MVIFTMLLLASASADPNVSAARRQLQETLPFCTGNFDGDQDVDVNDLLNVLSSFMVSADADTDDDGDTDVIDLLNVLAGFGSDCTSVPAPPITFAAGATTVKMGSDAGQLVFVPDEVKICKGDSVTWVNNKGGPHNVVFDGDNIPSGVDADSISMDDQLGDEGATYTKSFSTAGTYAYYCEPHAGAGMLGTLIVE